MTKFKSLFFILLAGVAGWAIYSLIHTAFLDLANYFGITNYYFQELFLIGIIILVLVLLGRKSNIMEALK